MYSFSDLGKNELVLRPEGTAGAVRFLLNNPSLMQHIEKEAVKMWYWGPMFRYERPQAGRLRQFYQIGVENIGGSSPQKDQLPDFGSMIEKVFEIIQSAALCLDQIFEHKLNFKIHINNLGTKDTLKLYNDELLKFFSSETNKDFLSDQSQ